MDVKKVFKGLENKVNRQMFKLSIAGIALSLPLIIIPATKLSQTSDPVLVKYDKIVQDIRTLKYNSSVEEIVYDDYFKHKIISLNEQKKQIESTEDLDDLRRTAQRERNKYMFYEMGAVLTFFFSLYKFVPYIGKKIDKIFD